MKKRRPALLFLVLIAAAGCIAAGAWMGSAFQQSFLKAKIEDMVTTTKVFTGYDSSNDVRDVGNAEPPLIQLTSEIYQVGGFRGLVSAIYLVRTPKPVLIDSGSRYGMPGLEKNLAKLGLTIGDLDLVIGTHAHWDHVDGVTRLVRDKRFHGKFALYKDDVPTAQNNDRDALAASQYYRLESDPVKVDIVLQEGPFPVGQKKFTVYHTPGHTPGSISLLTESDGLKILFVGDSVKGYYLPRAGSDLAAWERSLEKLLAVDFDLILEGHGQRYQKNVVRDQLELVRKGYLVWPTR